MAKRTNKYGMIYFEQDDFTNAQYEMQRWETLDAQLQSLFAIMGNGVLYGWNINKIPDGGLTCSISPGAGHVGFVAVESNTESLLTLNPNSHNHIYAQLMPDSYWTKKVNFVSFLDLLNVDIENNLYIGVVETDQDEILNIDISVRQELGFLALINDEIKRHRHNGAENNPPPIDLSSEVRGIINQNNLPYLDASMIKTGTISHHVLPQIDHNENLINNGTLTHNQIDSYIETLNINEKGLMGEVSTINLMQLILSIKHIYPDIDEFLRNHIAFIPGISPDDWIDFENTTAIVDTRTYAEGGQHTISGVSENNLSHHSHHWGQDNLNYANFDNTIISRNRMMLNLVESEHSLEDFNDIDEWTILLETSKNVESSFMLDVTNYVTPPNSGKMDINNSNTEARVILNKTFSSQDWTNYNFLHFFIFTENINHGDLFFYMNENFNTSTKILDRNTPTINANTLINGWQEVIIDLRNFERSSIRSIGFYVSTRQGWNVSRGFDINLDSFVLKSGNVHRNSGYAEFYFNSSTPLYFNSIVLNHILSTSSFDEEWDGMLMNIEATFSQTGTNGISNTFFRNVEKNISLYNFNLPLNIMYNSAVIRINFQSSFDLSKSPILKELTLNYSMVSEENTFNVSSSNEWKNGTLFNMKIDEENGNLYIEDLENKDTIIYGNDGNLNFLDDEFNPIMKLNGFKIPNGVNQLLNHKPSGHGLITGASYGEKNNIWVSDIDNDRVLELDKYGNLIKGFYGSFSYDPLNEIDIRQTLFSSNQYINAIGVVFNPLRYSLYVIFDKIIQNIDDIPYMYIMMGSHMIYIHNMDKQMATENVVEIPFASSDQILIDNFLDNKHPSIEIYSHYNNQIIEKDTIIKFIVHDYNIEDGIVALLNETEEINIYDPVLELNDLDNGINKIQFKLPDETELTELLLIVEDTKINDPVLKITTPLSGQMHSSNIVYIEFESYNFPILNNGQHLQYQIDNDIIYNHYSFDPIKLYDLELGKHIINVWMVDENEEKLNYSYSECHVDFLVGLNYNSSIKLYSSDLRDEKTIKKVNLVNIANIQYISLYSPIDVQFVPTSIYKSEPTVLISKLY